jgi:molecular chaperone DnaJ
MQTTSTCPHCGGEGKVITDKCLDCAGNGITKGEEIVTIKIPAGVGDGMQLSMSGKGNAAARGGIAGDLLIQIEEVKHPGLVRDGNNLLFNYYISIPEAALGSNADIPGIDGNIKLKIEAGTQSGRIIRLKGKGLPSVNSYEGKGDLLVTIHVWTPKTLSKEERALLERLAKSSNFQPSPSEKEKGFFSKMKDIFE